MLEAQPFLYTYWSERYVDNYWWRVGSQPAVINLSAESSPHSLTPAKGTRWCRGEGCLWETETAHFCFPIFHPRLSPRSSLLPPHDSSLCWRASYRLPSHVRRAQSGLITLPLVALPAAVVKRDEHGERWSEYQPGRFLEVGRRRVFVITRTWCLETGRRQEEEEEVEGVARRRTRQMPQGSQGKPWKKLVAQLIFFVTKQDGVNSNERIYPGFSHDWWIHAFGASSLFLFALRTSSCQNVHVFLPMLFAHAYFMALLFRSVWSTASLIGLDPVFSPQPCPSGLRKSTIAQLERVHTFQQSKPVSTIWRLAK